KSQRIYGCLDGILQCVPTKVDLHVQVHVTTGNLRRKLRYRINALVHVEASAKVVEYVSDPAFPRHKNGFAVIAEGVDSLNFFRTHKEWILTAFNLVLIVSAARLDVRDITKVLDVPLAGEAGQALAAGEQGLHRALLDGALLGDELLQRLDQRIRIAQRFGDGFLLDSWWQCDWAIC